MVNLVNEDPSMSCLDAFEARATKPSATHSNPREHFRLVTRTSFEMRLDFNGGSFSWRPSTNNSNTQLPLREKAQHPLQQQQQEQQQLQQQH